MTLTIEPSIESEAILQREAAQRGVTVEQLAREIFEEMMEDLGDAAEAEHIIASTDPKQWRTLNELRLAVRGQ